MQETFYEETTTLIKYNSEKIKHSIINILSIFSYVCSAIVLLLVFYFFDWSKGSLILNVVIIVLIFAIFIAGGVLLGIFKNKFCIEYDYIFLNGTINIDKVIRGARRKGQIEFTTHDILKVGKFCSEEYYKISSDDSIDVNVYTSNEEPATNKEFYYVLISRAGKKSILVLECTRTFIVNIAKFSSKTIFEKGL